MPVSINGTNGLTFNDGTVQNTVGYSPWRNRIINGDMRIDQRRNGASVTIGADDVYTTDRWMVQASQASRLTAQQNAGSVAPPASFANYLGLTSSSAYSVLTGDFFSLQQRIEGFNFADLSWGTANAQAVTISFWVRSSLTGSFGASLRNNGATRSYPFSYSINAANTWEQKTVTIAGDTAGTWLTTNGIGAILSFGLGVGSTFSGAAGSWSGSNLLVPTGSVSVVGTNGATFYITGVQLEAGTTATPFERVEFGESLRRCQRYYADLGPHIVDFVGGPLGSAGYTPYVSTPLKVTMRASPTISASNYVNTGGPTTASLAITSVVNTNTYAYYILKGANAWGSGSNTFTFNLAAAVEL
jgi:hypothetical protein